MFIEKYDLNTEILTTISYRSSLNKSLSNDLNNFNKQELLQDVRNALIWYNTLSKEIKPIKAEYRIKSYASAVLKYDRNINVHKSVKKVFNDLFGIRIICEDYNEFWFEEEKHYKYVDLSGGKKIDDGYRGIHIYFELSNHHYPIEIQLNTYADRLFNDMSHKYIYKKGYDPCIGHKLRVLYEQGRIHDDMEFLEELRNVLPDCER